MGMPLLIPWKYSSMLRLATPHAANKANLDDMNPQRLSIAASGAIYPGKPKECVAQ